MARYNTQIDYARLDVQEGVAPIPADHPDRKHLEATRNAVANMTPGERAERAEIYGQLVRVAQVYARYGDGIDNSALRNSEIAKIRGGEEKQRIGSSDLRNSKAKSIKYIRGFRNGE